jgi:hypothetical protein
MNIVLTNTGEIKEYNQYFKPYILKADKPMPAMYNAGMNSFRFDVEPVFELQNMPLDLKTETDNYIYFESVVRVEQNEKTWSGYFYATQEKATGKFIKYCVDFS